MRRHLRAILLCIAATTVAWATLSPKDGHARGFASEHDFGIAVASGMPHLISGEFRLLMVRNFEFGAGFGAFPVNTIAQSVYTFSPTPLDLGTGDTYNLYPRGNYSLSGIYALARWFPWGSGFFVHLSYHHVSFSASIDGSLRNETLGTSVSGAIDGSVAISQGIVNFGPGYQFRIGQRFHVDLGAGLLFLLPASATTRVGGSLSGFAALDASASANYESAKQDLVGAVNDAMSRYRDTVRFLPSLYLTMGYLF